MVGRSIYSTEVQLALPNNRELYPSKDPAKFDAGKLGLYSIDVLPGVDAN